MTLGGVVLHRDGGQVSIYLELYVEREQIG